jgi:hypothetical protein
MRRIATVFVLTWAIFNFAVKGLAETLPATFFGMHVNQSQTTWPNVGFGSYRLWDDGTSWANVNTSRGAYNWAPLDSWVNKAQQHNVQLLYTFGRTPLWASSSPTTSCDYGTGQCVAPSDYSYWDDFVTALATRYKGKIKYYEMWNEPNDAGFWKGTTDQMVEMTRRAANIIHSIDPNAEVVSPSATWSSTTAWAWLDGFLTAGGGSYLDDIGVHGYTGNNKAESIFTIIDNMQDVQAAHGYSLPLMITEGGWGENTVITDQDAQAAFLVQRYLLITARPAVASLFWYAWDSPTWGTLWDSTNGIHKDGVAYGQLTSWLIGATANGCGKDANSTWTCSYTLAKGNTALAVFNATTSVSYTPGSQYTQVLGIYGSLSSINGSSPYSVGNAPVLFTSPETAALPTATLLVATPSSGIAPVTVSASVSSTVGSGLTLKSISISFDDGTIVNASSASHTFINPGDYSIQATVTDSLNRTATSSKTVIVTANLPPQIVLSVSPSIGKVPMVVTASTAASTDPDGSIAFSSINFGDGTVVSGSTSTHTYTTAGTYTVTATVKDNLAASSTATATVAASVTDKAAPVINWAKPAAVAYGTSLSSSQLNATANTPGIFVYTPATGTTPATGVDTLSASFTPTDATDYTTATQTVSLTVNKATPVISWATPTAVSYGTTLSSTQLNATANTPGIFVYIPKTGSTTATGVDTLSVSFTPTDTTDYTTAMQTVSLTVNKNATMVTVSAGNSATYGNVVGLTAAVIPASSTGTVTFKNGSATLGTGTLSGGTVSLTLAAITANGFTVGSDSITAIYGGDTDDSGSTSSAATLIVMEGTTTTVTDSASSIALGSSSATQSLTATVTTNSGTPTGTVTFKVGSLTAGSAPLSGRSATLSVAPTTANGFTVGSNTVTASYAPATGSGFTASSGTQTLTVNAPAYTITPASTSLSLSKGGSQLDTVTLASTTFADTTAWTATTSSPLITVSPSSGTATLSANGNSTASLTITASGSAANHAPRLPWTGPGLIAIGAVLAGVPLARRRKRVVAVLVMALAISAFGFLMSCGGGGGGSTPPVSPRSYTVTITGTGGIISTIAVTVQ